ncbi:hypothetical protein H6G97_13955 [Nostoc flagelliforme FACHB-838]|uniref:Uncharacterized protein n=1 Tax=Nostoc flagelliforme FACHB-838 TaxID=2692904 RepID=A0ABR8DNX0_9NOSO|nr:hypothetical protein [Nostoc flagelliforme]MBD2530615.1 hypothetical protein [Nostoc flagelliforme FACHB-838]
MAKHFPIIEIPPDAPEDTEDLGTKEKFWFHHQDLGLCLYKKARPNTGEDWSEKIASELSDLLELPHADYELATFNSERGTLKAVDAFREAQQRHPNAARVWLNNLARVSSNDTLDIFKRIPSERISQTAIEFAQKILEFNQSRLLKLQDTLL